jgi:hypothetical protein
MFIWFYLETLISWYYFVPIPIFFNWVFIFVVAFSNPMNDHPGKLVLTRVLITLIFIFHERVMRLSILGTAAFESSWMRPLNLIVRCLKHVCLLHTLLMTALSQHAGRSCLPQLTHFLQVIDLTKVTDCRFVTACRSSRICDWLDY